VALLAWIIFFTAVGGIASAAFAGLFLLVPQEAGRRLLPHFISYATGALLGAALLALLPEAIESVGPDGAQGIGVALLVGLGIFFVIEKLVLWWHTHSNGQRADEPGRAGERGVDLKHGAPADHDAHGDHGHDHGGHGMHVDHGHDHGTHDHGAHTASGVLVIIGDSIHNALDGVLIAAAFLTSFPLGLVTTFAVAAHEIPHRVGDFAILVHSGMSRRRALTMNMATGLTSILGGIAAFFGLQRALGALPYALAFAAAGFLYIAVAGLIPGLHRRADPRTSLAQVVLMGLGVGTIAWAESLAHQ
jgi:zinc and cadmium transporter